MDILSELYYKSAAENEKNFHFWENYLQSLKSLDFSIYSDKLKVPTLVPIGSRISFRGELKHTNEITAALGADYFVKCSLKQAEVLRQHRIRDAQSKVDMFNKEKDYLENQMSFTQKTIYDNPGKEIIEYYSTEDDKAWRQEHREKVRQYKQNKGKDDEAETKDVTDEELWNRLEELELQEELENELSEMNDDIPHTATTKKKASVQEYLIDELEDYIKLKSDEAEKEKSNQEKFNSGKERMEESKDKKVSFKETETLEQPSKLDKLQQVIDKQNELEEKLFELKNRERGQTNTETDLMSRLDELEKLDDLEDEMDRLDDIIENADVDEEDEEEEEDTSETKAPQLERRVSFVDEDDSNTLEITFKHSPVDTNYEPYNPDEGIQKPSDIYDAHSKSFGTKSILKTSKYEAMSDTPDTKVSTERGVQFDIQDNKETIVIKDVVEKVTQVIDPKLISHARPSSLFKKKRMQNKQ